jgi:zinc finger SWIM domain-containing protein 3
MGEIDKGTPQIGMRFRNLDTAWRFDVRKRNKHVSKIDGEVTSCTFVCSNEGIRKKGITMDHVPKRVRAETRTNCKARIIISLDRVAKNFEVTYVDLEHNHLLQLPQTCHLMASQRKITELQALEIEAAEDSGIMPKAAHEYANYSSLWPKCTSRLAYSTYLKNDVRTNC